MNTARVPEQPQLDHVPSLTSAGGIKQRGNRVRAEDANRTPPNGLDDFLAMRGVKKEIGPELEGEAKGALRQTPHGDRARQNWTHVDFTVIDPHGAQDHDDAVHCEKTKNGWKLFVAIADVGAIVRPGTELDQQICNRAQSIYLPDETIPMCPKILSEDACSLTGEEPKRALLTVIDVDRDGRTAARETMRPSWVRIKRTITYDEAEEGLEHGDCELETLRQCTDALREARRGAGAIILTMSAETPVHRDENGQPVTGPYPNMLASEGLIEESMIATSHENAQWLRAQGAQGIVFRNHAEPGRKNMAAARAVAKALSLRGTEDKDPRIFIQNILEENRERKPWAEFVVRIAMEKAAYEDEPGPHFGLAKACYAQTTSPIRRYGDLVAQQAAHAIHATPGSTMPFSHPDLAPWLTGCERRALDCERHAAKKWNLRTITPEDLSRWMPGRVVSVRRYGLFAEAKEIAGVQGLAHTSTLKRYDWWVLDDYATLRGRSSGQTWRVGDHVEIRIAAVKVPKAELSILVRRPSGTPSAEQ